MSGLKSTFRKTVPKPLVKAAENGLRTSRGVFYKTKYGFPARGQRIIAVTGTNGKTTTVSYINAMLKCAGYKTAVFTTAYYEIDGHYEPNRTHMTVHSQKTVQSFLRRAKDAKVDYVVLEITSMALDQKRVSGIKPEIAVMTNLTQDHLDYHGTMERYAAAKARLFSKEYAPSYCVLNRDDSWYSYFKERCIGQVVSYGSINQANVHFGAVKLTQNESTTKLTSGGVLKTQLLGLFNLYNAAAALAVANILNIDQKLALDGLESLEQVPGRMERIDAGQPFSVLVDFAVTPDALEKVLSSMQRTAKGRVFIVFGATGDRDKDKRPKMGYIAGTLADAIYLTDDETYTEDPETIRDAVMKGIIEAKATKKTKVIPDRLEAITTAFKDARAGDVVVLAGIGSEDYRNMGGKKEPWDEREIAKTLLIKL